MNDTNRNNAANTNGGDTPPPPVRWHLAQNLTTANKQTESAQMMTSVIWALVCFCYWFPCFLLSNLTLFILITTTTPPSLHHPCEPPSTLHHHCEPLLAGWQQVPSATSHSTTTLPASHCSQGAMEVLAMMKHRIMDNNTNECQCQRITMLMNANANKH